MFPMPTPIEASPTLPHGTLLHRTTLCCAVARGHRSYCLLTATWRLCINDNSSSNVSQGIQPLWAEDDALLLPFSYVRGQNVELIREEGQGGSNSETLTSVLLSGEYIIPKTFISSKGKGQEEGQGQGHEEGSWGDSLECGTGTRTSGLLIGGTHEHALTMAELEAPADMQVASSLLMGKMRTMYPALDREGWRPSRCIAGEGTV